MTTNHSWSRAKWARKPASSSVSSPGAGRERRDLADVRRDGLLLGGGGVVVERERPERLHPRVGGPSPSARTTPGTPSARHRYDVQPSAAARPTASWSGWPSSAPGGGEHRVAAVADQVHEAVVIAGDVSRQGAVGQPEPGDRVGGRRRARSGRGVLLRPPCGQCLGGVGRRARVAAVAVAGAEEVDVEAGRGRGGDQATRPERLVVGVGAETTTRRRTPSRVAAGAPAAGSGPASRPPPPCPGRGP